MSRQNGTGTETDRRAGRWNRTDTRKQTAPTERLVFTPRTGASESGRKREYFQQTALERAPPEQGNVRLPPHLTPHARASEREVLDLRQKQRL